MIEKTKAASISISAKTRIEAAYRAYLTGLIEGLERAYGRVNDTFPESREEWESWAPRLRRKLRRDVLKFPPEDIPLKPQVLDRREYEDYAIEKLIYQTEEDQFITANLYLPKEVQFPVPGIAVGTGHGGSKSTDYNQYGGQIYARAGCVVLIPDNIGEGDRRFGGGHWSLADSGTLVGRPIQGKIIWDFMRAIDYLCTRPEVDRERIACIGHSLGGFISSYAAALDERVSLAIPASSAAVSHLGEQFRAVCCFMPFRVNCYADRPEIVSLIAPRPCLLNAGALDGVRIERVRETYRVAGRVYGLLDARDNLALNVVENDGHAPLHLNKASFAFIGKHFGFPRFGAEEIQGLGERTNPEFRQYRETRLVDLPVVYEATETEEEGLHKSTVCPALDCLSPDEVRDPRFSTSGWRERVTRGLPPEFQIPDSGERWNRWREEGRQKVRKLLRIPGYSPINANPDRMRARVLEKTGLEGGLSREVICLGDLEILAFLWLPPADGPVPLVFYLHGSRTGEGAFTPEVRQWLDRNEAVISLDLVTLSMGAGSDLGCGTSATAVNVGQLRCALEFVQSRAEIDQSRFRCVGEVDDVALYWGIVEDRIDDIVLRSRGGMEPQEVYHITSRWGAKGGERYEGIVPEAWIHFSRAELLSLLAPRNLTLQSKETSEDLVKVRRVYALLGAEDRLRTSGNGSGIDC